MLWFGYACFPPQAKIAAQEERLALKHKKMEETLLHMRRDSGKKMITAEWAEGEAFDAWQVLLRLD